MLLTVFAFWADSTVATNIAAASVPAPEISADRASAEGEPGSVGTIPGSIITGETVRAAKTVLVVYPTPRILRGTLPWQERDWPTMMQNLLGHFDVEVTLRTSGAYQEGDLARYDAFIYMGTYPEKVPRTLLRDVAGSQKPVMWLGRNIEQLDVAGGPRWQTRLSERQSVAYIYKDRTINANRPQQMNLVREFPVDSVVWAWADTPQGRFPFGLRNHRFWYVADTDLHSRAYLLVADQLYDFLGQPSEGKRWATLRIEDVHPLRSAETLRQFADALKSRNIPFMVTVVPVYVNPKTGERVTLSERPDLVEALRYMEASGGTILVHGLTHQVGDVETGWGFEFWDADREEPVVSKTFPDWAEKRWDRAINDLRALGLRPLGITVPHYAMNRDTYVQLRDRVDLLVGSPQISGHSRLTQKVPYLLKKDQYGYRVIPENIGFFDFRKEDPVAPMLKAAEEVTLVRDCAAGAFFHSFLDSGRLVQLVDGLRERGFAFLDPHNLPVREALPTASPEHGVGAISEADVFWDPIVNGDTSKGALFPWLGMAGEETPLLFAAAIALAGVTAAALVLIIRAGVGAGNKKR
ncbi:DUF2334 domain-containing protein [Heliobacterium undosum]|uniref:DUF2334 domain-containing protein n=1 Tax=Heliomicrobium undosum TaxID=121734 RepID=A0A845LB79_9FIRM|nr:polysaccharide deacetylase family protein [Heliomicrobium undosum]MZP30181.1 DUF2334 domain-containing protein [Heliomicrobium undosum]